MKFGVATFNVAGAVKRSRRVYGRLLPEESARLTGRARTNLTAIADAARDVAADIINLQEVDTCFSRAGPVEQWEELAADLEMHSTFTPSSTLNALGLLQFRTGIATLSRFPVLRWRRVDFKSRGCKAKKRLMGAVLGHKAALHTTVAVSGLELHVLNAHLTHESAAQRERELKSLLEYCAALDPVLLMGDLNTTPPGLWDADTVHPQPIADGCMAILRQFVATHPGRLQCDERLANFAPSPASLSALATAPADEPRYKFDYIFLLTKNPRLRLSMETVHAFPLSDHRLVTAELEVALD